jgi:ATP adenylyltransferase
MPEAPSGHPFNIHNLAFTINPMDVLWAPWRMAYIGGPKDERCLFCVQADAADQRAALVLARPRGAIVMLNRFPYANGHVMVAPRQHTADLNALPATDYADLNEALRGAAAALEQVLHPEGLNVGLNLGRAAGAGITDHLHWHIVPRWVGDVNYMPLIAEVRVIPEHLESIYDRLRPAFVALESR